MNESYVTPSYERCVVKSDEESRIRELSYFAPNLNCQEISTNIIVINRVYLLAIINDAIARGYTDLYDDVFSKSLTDRRVFSYNYTGYILRISSLKSYYAASMSLLSEEARSGLISVPKRPIYTKVRNSAPTLYKEGATVKNSYIADGCEIEGTVENSIIFRGVRISRGAVVRGAIILQDTYIGEDSKLNSVIADKDVTIKSGRNLSGDITMPFYIAKGSIV
jgi:glucose-1-phosphate adenylyltransferase